MTTSGARGALTSLRMRLRPRTRLIRAVHRARRSRMGLRLLQNAVVDLRFGGWAGGMRASPFAALGASRVQSTDCAALARLFRCPGLDVRATDVLVDVGCGRGRVINWWLSRGWRNRMVGLELVDEVAAETARRLRRFPNVEVRCGDAAKVLPPEGTLFYLYNPFDAPVMRRFADAVLARAASAGRTSASIRAPAAGQHDHGWRVQRMEGVRCRGIGSVSRVAATGGLRPTVHTGAGLPTPHRPVGCASRTRGGGVGAARKRMVHRTPAGVRLHCVLRAEPRSRYDRRTKRAPQH